jgi:iron complex transport system ATP-binding protein
MVNDDGAVGVVLERQELLSGVVYERRDRSIVLRLDAPWQVLSSAVLGGGRRHARAVLNLRVSLAYRNMHPERDLREAARALELPGPVVGMMTAVDLAEAQVFAGQVGETALRAVITAGLRNASRPGDPAVGTPGTINAVFLCATRLRDPAAVELAMLIAEAKAAAMVESGLVTTSGRRASGTSTDAVAILWRQTRGPEIRHAGASTGLGELAGRIMSAAVNAVVARTGARAVGEQP